MYHCEMPTCTTPSKTKANSFQSTVKRKLNSLWLALPTLRNSKKLQKCDTDSLQSITIVFCVSFGVFCLMALVALLGAFVFDYPPPQNPYHSASVSYETHNAKKITDTPLDSYSDIIDLHDAYADWVQMDHIDVATVDRDLEEIISLASHLYDGVSEAKNHTNYDKKLTQIVYDHCAHELHFGLSDSAFNSLTAQFETFLFHFIEKTPLVLFEEHSNANYVVTDTGKILSDGDESLQRTGMTENVNYGYCALLHETMQRLTERGLTQYTRISEHAAEDVSIGKDVDLLIWQKHAHLFSLTNENEDAFALIHESFKTTAAGNFDEEHEKLQIMAYHLLHEYCGNVFDHLEEVQSRQVFVEQVTTHLRLLYDDDIYILHDEVPIVSRDGTIFVDKRDFHLRHAHEYTTCTFLQKLVQYHPGDIHEQMTRALRSIRLVDAEQSDIKSKSMTTSDMLSFDLKMDLLFEEHCAEMVSRLEANYAYHIGFRDVFYEMASDLANGEKKRKMSATQKFVVNVRNGDIISNEHNTAKEHVHDVVECPLVDYLVSTYARDDGVHTQQQQNTDYKVSDFDVHLYAAGDADAKKATTKNEYAADILKYVRSGDLSNLRHIIGESIAQFHDADMKMHFVIGSDRHRSSIQTLSASIEQFVVQMVDSAARHDKNELSASHIIVADILSGLCVAVPDERRFKELQSNWVRVDVLDAVKSLILTENNETATRTTTTATADTDTELLHYVHLLWKDIGKLREHAQKNNQMGVMEQFDEDFVYGLDTFCSQMMAQLKAVAQRKLRSSIASAVVQSEAIEMPIVTSGGDIIPFAANSDASAAQFFKCQFVEALMTVKSK